MALSSSAKQTLGTLVTLESLLGSSLSGGVTGSGRKMNVEDSDLENSKETLMGKV